MCWLAGETIETDAAGTGELLTKRQSAEKRIDCLGFPYDDAFVVSSSLSKCDVDYDDWIVGCVLIGFQLSYVKFSLS